ncbi:hypothetical protein AKO1_001214 [Acrasis kona]|uniref:RING-type domain-containing protein n=1 Tax=Acrasis kona TaxID=1008807 RepID=A0AAW2ZDW1_9EUKA
MEADFNKVTNDPPIYMRNIPLNDQNIDSKLDLPWVTRKRGCENTRDLVDVVVCKEARDLIKELRTAINLCGQNSEKKTLDDAEVKQLWFKLLDTFLIFQRKLRYGYVVGQPLPEPSLTTNAAQSSTSTSSKKASKKQYNSDNSDDSDDDDSDDDDDEEELDEISETKNEIIDVSNKIQALEKTLSDLRDKKPTDEAQIEKITQKLKREKDHSVTLQLTLRKLEDAERKLKTAEEERNNDANAAHNIPKIVNLWLQRVNAHAIRIVLGDLMRYVDIPTILNKIVDEHHRDPFGHVKITLTRMLDCFSYKCMLLETANGLISYDTFELGNIYHDVRTKGVKVKSRVCHVCRQSLAARSDNQHPDVEATIRLFPCGHAYHSVCAGPYGVVCQECVPLENKELKNLAKVHPTLRQESKSLMNKAPTYSCHNKIKLWEKVNHKLTSKSAYQLMKEIDNPAGNGKKNKADVMMDRVGMLLGLLSTQQAVEGEEKLLNLRPPVQNSFMLNDDDVSEVSETVKNPVEGDDNGDENYKTKKNVTRSNVSGGGLMHKTVDICDLQDVISNLL